MTIAPAVSGARDTVPALVVVALALTGALFVALAIPLMRRKIPPNGLYGLRINATFANDRVWYEANAASGRDLALLGVLLLSLAVALPLAGLSQDVYLLGWSAVAVIGALVMCVLGVRRANRMLREVATLTEESRNRR